MRNSATRSSSIRASRRLLVIGGTGDAAKLVRLAAERFGDRLEITTSLAGRTCAPAPLPGAVRIGGFGGASGLARWIIENDVEFVIDATHPFAAVISENTRTACASAGATRLVLGRAQWTAEPGDRWLPVSDADAAARLLPKVGHRPFLTVGGRDISSFSVLGSVHIVVRLIDEPPEPLPLVSYALVRGRGPFEREPEQKLLKQYAIDVVVTKNSGGQATYAKIEAARYARIPVIMIERPPAVEGERVEHPKDALSWIEERLK
jgi:precorrin-6A/cobalt-precorrin-6A reductase